ncbi:hypothetical protein ACOI1C_06405 [Bacillus sp. DJP31]|uniref:hypothetical protein n=1 Tax=Bacillus sp. DJP31 TaxID=3409789 RepID=UPI003BB53279
MSKCFSVLILILIGNVILYFVLGVLFNSNILYETLIYTFSTIIIILLSVLISLLVYLTSILKEKQ